MFSSAYFRMALILGLLSAIGPFAIDMYLPALPDIGRALGADVEVRTQGSLTLGVLGRLDDLPRVLRRALG